MNSTIIRNVSRAGGILQKRSIFLYTAPRPAIPPQLVKPILPNIYFAPHRFTPSRLLSTTIRLSKYVEDITADWNSGPIPDAEKWGQRMDSLVAKGINSEDDVHNWVNLLGEGIEAGLYNIEEIVARNREGSQDIDSLVGDAFAQGMGETWNGRMDYDEDFDEDQEFGEEDIGDDEGYYPLEELSDEEIEELVEQAEEEQGGWAATDEEGGYDLEEDPYDEQPDGVEGEDFVGEGEGEHRD